VTEVKGIVHNDKVVSNLAGDLGEEVVADDAKVHVAFNKFTNNVGGALEPYLNVIELRAHKAHWR
jgi:hypothetical protein